MVAALAEPDYGGRIDYPDELANPGILQADPSRPTGRTHTWAADWQSSPQAGLSNIHTGCMGGEWENTRPGFIQQEWEVLRQDLQGWLPNPKCAACGALDVEAWRSGMRILYVPTFYAWGKVRDNLITGCQKSRYRL